MKFASLLKMHQNQQAVPSYPNNQYLVNCNNKLQQPIIYGGSNYSTLKKRSFEPRESLNQRLEDIFRSYEQNPHTHWILELEAHNVRIHKFQPSKFKHRKQQQEIHEQQIYPKMTQHNQRHLQPHHQPNHPQDEVQPSHRFNLRQNQQTRKNYSPMQKMRPKTFGRQQNWMQNLNQNKFSFGQDSVHALQQANNQRQYQPQQNTGNKSYIQQRHDYELPHQDLGQRPKSYCVNLMNEFEKCDQFKDELNTNNEKEVSKKLFNQLADLEKEQNANLEKPIEQQKNPDSRIDFNPNVGFSFEQIDKICQPTQNTIGPVSQNKVQHKSQTQVVNTNNAISSLKQAKKPQEQLKIVQKPSLPRQTSLKKIIDEGQNKLKTKTQVQEQSLKKIQIKPIELSAPPSQTKQKQSSPHRIYCKANIRNLTPQKFKYPRVDSKIQSNTQVKPFLAETETKITKTEVGTIRANTEKKTQNTGQRQMITVPSSERLEALIDESKRLLESKHVNEEVRPEDKIKRIVLHQTVTIENPGKTENIQLKDVKVQQNETNHKNLEAKAPKITINAPEQINQRQKKQIQVTPKKKQIQLQTVSSPKSPTQQKPKFHNQLANMQTNYTPKKIINDNLEKNQLSQGKNMIMNPITNPSPKYTTNPDPSQKVSTYTKTQLESNNTTKNHTTQQQNYFQSNYAYKPLNVPQYNNNIKINENKDLLGGYKAQKYPSTTVQIGNNQTYQPIINTYQQLNEASYQTSYQQMQKATTNGTQVYTNNNNATTATTNIPTTKTYSPYFPTTTTTTTTNPINKPSLPTHPTQTKPLTPPSYQPYSYTNFPSSQPQIQPSSQPLSVNNQNNNYIKINANYISPLEKYQMKHENKETYQNYQGNATEWRQKENLKPMNGLGIQGVKCVQSKIYQPSSYRMNTVQQDPKESSVQFSLRIQEHFHIGNK